MINNCNECNHRLRQPGLGHCYMFKNEPQYCVQFKPGYRPNDEITQLKLAEKNMSEVFTMRMEEIASLKAMCIEHRDGRLDALEKLAVLEKQLAECKKVLFEAWPYVSAELDYQRMKTKHFPDHGENTKALQAVESCLAAINAAI